jgi:hypothetical protein
VCCAAAVVCIFHAGPDVGFRPNGPAAPEQGRRHEPVHPRRRPRRSDQRHRIRLAAQSHRRYRRRKSNVCDGYFINNLVKYSIPFIFFLFLLDLFNGRLCVCIYIMTLAIWCVSQQPQERDGAGGRSQITGGHRR